MQKKKKKVIKYPLLDHVPTDRTEKGTMHHLKLLKDSNNKKAVFGFKNESPLISLMYFNIIRGFVPDVMHCVFLGVCKQFAHYWFAEKKKPYSINKFWCEFVNNLLKKIRVPKIVNRLTRKINDRKFWKSRDWEIGYFFILCQY